MTNKEEVLAACDLLEITMVYSTQERRAAGIWPLHFISKKTHDYVLLSLLNTNIKTFDADIAHLEIRQLLVHGQCKSEEEAIFTRAREILQSSKLTIDGKEIGPLNWTSLKELELKLVAMGIK